jgi:competence protein ComEA
MDRCIVLILALALTLPVVVKSRPGIQTATRTAFSVLSSHRLVAVSGDVHHPGIYSCSANSVTGGVILMAEHFGGQPVFLPKGIERLPLRNGSDIRVTRNLDGTLVVTVGAIPVAQRIVLGIPLDMNVMTEADFERVPGIGPVLAKRILEYRQFNGGMLRPRDLLSIEGIGKATYSRLQKYF